MMRVHVLFAVLLASSLIADTEAGWFRRAFRWVGRAVRNVGTWVGDHCAIGPGIRCSIRFKRAVDLNKLNVSVIDTFNAAELSPGEDICSLVKEANMPFDGFAKEVLEMFFDQADQDKDKELSAQEFKFYANAIVVYQQCLPLEPK